jgi:hypothetical protein
MAKSKPNIWRRFFIWLSKTWQKTYPAPSVRKGAALAVFVLIGLFCVGFGWFIRPGLPGILDGLAGVVFFVLMALLIGLAAALSLKVLSGLPRFLNTSGLVAMIALVFILAESNMPFFAAVMLALVLGAPAALLGGGLGALFNREFKFERPLKKILVFAKVIVPVAMFVLCIIWLIDSGTTKYLVEQPVSTLQVEALDANNPSRPGPFKVLTMTYGSGTDKHRPEFGEEAVLKTEPVDASPFLKDSKGFKVKFRKWYWGFGFKEFPVNGRVWYPAGDGPFPLVLIVHGNHKMQQYSDPGYAYLGELMASRGFIFVSVDENFFNAAFMSGLSRENDGRGWMLLQHLKVWREWNRIEGNPFFEKVDMNNIGLIGHSRGGEAAAIAGNFNRLSRYPDDATVTFDFGFSIKAIIAIAPSDQQYRPAGQPNPLDNINYLVFQGAHDADVSMFLGARQYERVKFTDKNYWFKASLYTYRSNHGQFNTVWGDNDWGKPMGIILNRKALLDGEEQRTISRVYISAFLETTLHGNRSYLPLFHDYRLIRDWLPEDIYINRFEDSTFKKICDFEEDVDVTTAALDGAEISGKNLAVWREADLKFRSSSTKENNVVFLGWRGTASERQGDSLPCYSIEMPENPGPGGEFFNDTLLIFSLADADEKIPESEEEEAEQDKKDKEKAEKADNKEKKKKEKEEKNKKPLKLSIELISKDGTKAKLPLDRFMPVPPVIKSRFTKISNESSLYGKAYEPTMQTYVLPLAVFKEEYPAFDPGQLRVIRFVFDLGREGVIILDNIGFSRLLTQ